ncbi:hypothetical protein Rhal01_03344 [Rubritalea halochordaticola]|uniref:Uncharacterized protein n=1 Tax=Rubritalea halochordaticola TaxID=714537 RepID=A0ABP9V5J7_9BACT
MLEQTSNGVFSAQFNANRNFTHMSEHLIKLLFLS